jgi:hypothetical protein
MTAAPHVDPRLLPGTPSLGGWRQDACFCAFLLRCTPTPAATAPPATTANLGGRPVTDVDRVAELEQRVAVLEEMFDAWMILAAAERRARERANGTHLRAVPDR